jgi:hypothetical protein
MPPAQVEYVERQPSLEDIFLALVRRRAGAESVLNDAAAVAADS